jgi:hypothetical protein
MGVTIAATRVNANTSTGDQTITTTDLGGLTPVAAVVFATAADEDGVAEDSTRLSYGATDGTRQWVFAGSSLHNVGTTSTRRRSAGDELIMILNATTGNIAGEANFKEWTTNGMVITWGDAPGDDRLITVIFFAGTDVSAYAERTNYSFTADTFLDESSPGFEPQFVAGCTNGNSGDDVVTTNNTNSFGFATWDGATVTQMSSTFADTHNQATSDVVHCVNDAKFLNNLYNGSATRTIEIGEFDASGFSLKHTLTASFYVGYLALDFSDVIDVSVDQLDSPTSTGNWAITAPGFTPQAVIGAVNMADTINNLEAADDVGVHGLAIWDADEQYCVSVASEDNVGTTNTQCLSNDQAIDLPIDDGTQTWVATLSSFDANGWTANFSATDGTARKWVFVSFGEETTAAGDSTPYLSGLRKRRFQPQIVR